MHTTQWVYVMYMDVHIYIYVYLYIFMLEYVFAQCTFMNLNVLA